MFDTFLMIAISNNSDVFFNYINAYLQLGDRWWRMLQEKEREIVVEITHLQISIGPLNLRIRTPFSLLGLEIDKINK